MASETSVAGPTNLVPPDRELITRSRSGDTRAAELLVARYQRLVSAVCRSFYLVGAEYEDLRAWGVYGLLLAIRDFDLSRERPFLPFAKQVVRHVVLSAIKAASRQKHVPLNERLSVCFDAGQEAEVQVFVHEEPAPEVCPLSGLRAEEFLRAAPSRLTALEWGILVGRLAEESYEETAARLGVKWKAVDNGWRRMREKARPLASELLEGCPE